MSDISKTISKDYIDYSLDIPFYARTVNEHWSCYDLEITLLFTILNVNGKNRCISISLKISIECCSRWHVYSRKDHSQYIFQF